MFIQASEHPSNGIRLGENYRTTMPSSELSMLLSEEPHAMDILSGIPYVIWVHGKGLTSLKHNQYTGVLSIQATKLPRSGARFGENCRCTMPFIGWCMLLHEEQHVIDRLSHIPHFWWCMGKVWQTWDIINTLGSCPFKPQSAQALGPYFVRTAKAPSHPYDCVCC